MTRPVKADGNTEVGRERTGTGAGRCTGIDAGSSSKENGGGVAETRVRSELGSSSKSSVSGTVTSSGVEHSGRGEGDVEGARGDGK